MTPKNLSTDQKIDLILEKIILLESGQKSLESGQKSLESGQKSLESNLKTLNSRIKSLEKNQKDLIKTVSEIALLSAKTADKLEEHCAQTDHSDTPRSFTPFKSGVFVA